jgi:Calcineurin-like phosphoesterase/Purple acid Phosphatase, N-terminal domain
MLSRFFSQLIHIVSVILLIIVVGLVPNSAPSALAASALTRGPFLQFSPSGDLKTEVVIGWTDNGAQADVIGVDYGLTTAYGSTRGGISTTHSSNGWRRFVTLTGLQPGQTYYYRVKSGGTYLTPAGDTNYSFNTDSDNRAFSFAVIGDFGVSGSPPGALVAGWDINLIVTTGDNIYSTGADTSFKAQYYDPYKPTLQKAFAAPVLGNHDYGTTCGVPFQDNHALPENASVGVHKERYYSFTYGNVLFVVLDVNKLWGNGSIPSPGVVCADAPTLNVGDSQYIWLRDVLANSTATWKVVAFHEMAWDAPGGKYGLPSSNDRRVANVLQPLFDQYRVDLVFEGHDHSYARSKTLNHCPNATCHANDGDLPFKVVNPGTGTIFVLNGNGGGGSSGLASSTNDLTAYAASPYFDGAARVTVNGNTMLVEQISTAGVVKDSVMLTKGSPNPTPTATATPAPATATPAPATPTATATPALATATRTATPTPATLTATATPAPATSTATATPAPATSTATATPAPATSTATATPAPATNRIPNPSFEIAGASISDATSWIEGNSHVRASDRTHSGSWALKSTFTGAGTATRSAAITVAPNTTYNFSGWIYKSSSTGAACLDMNDISGERQLCASTTNAWQFLSGSWNSGSNTSVVIRLVTDGTPNGANWFDDIALQ